MNQYFLIIGDIHLKETQKFDYEVLNAVANLFNNMQDVGGISIIIAGDVAYSAKKSEYLHFGKLLASLISFIKKALNKRVYINVYMVPGNHDINFDNKTRNRLDVLSMLNNGTIEENIGKELVNFNNFYELAGRNNCFKKNKIIDTLFINDQFKKPVVQVNLLNSELFSTLRDVNGDDDKGVHYFPENEFDKIKKIKSVDFVVTIMHRSPEWFNYEDMSKLKHSIYKYSNILVFGHDHLVDSYDAIKNDENLLVINPGVFDFGQNVYHCSLLKIDSITRNYLLKNYTWDNNDKIFISNNSQNNKLNVVNESNLLPISEFSDEFYKLDNYELDDVFTFPDLDKICEKEIKHIKNIDDFFDDLNINNIIYIEGDNYSGKTSLCKAIYKESFKYNYVPLYLDVGGMDKKYTNIIRSCFCEQYGYGVGKFEKFQQLKHKEKLAIIDNYDKIPSQKLEEFKNKLEQEFGNVIYVSKPINNGNIIEETKKSITSSENIYKILPFYLKKRIELIGKLLSCQQINSDIEEKVDEINKFIVDQLKVFSLDPAFITKYVSFYMNKNSMEDLQSNIFNRVFESSITMALQNIVNDSNTVSEYFRTFEIIANKVHFKKQYPITSKDIEDIIKNYNQEYGLDIKCDLFLKNAIDAKLFVRVGDGKYWFYKNSILAYFVAKSVNYEYVNDGEEEHLKWLCENVCYNINGEILLFLSYITSNKNILKFIYGKALEVMGPWEELDLDNTKISFLNKTLENDEKILAPTLKDKERHKNKMEDRERDFIRDLTIKAKAIYDDYNEKKKDSEEYIVNQSIKYLELVSKILPNFNHDLKLVEKSDLVNALYSFPNKICYKIFTNVDKNLQETIDDLMEYCSDNNITLTREEIVDELQKMSRQFMLCIFDMVARLSTNNKTIKILSEQELKTINYKILNIMMYENNGSFKEFTDRAIDIFDNSKNPFVNSMIIRIVRKHYLTKNIKQVRDGQRVAEKFFGKSRKFLL